MSNRHHQAATARSGGLRAVVSGVSTLHVAGLALLVLAAWQGATIFGLGLLAYLFGLRHAFDVDHIAAIDNVTRKLTRDGKRSTEVGFAFSLGHSTVVFALCLLVVLFSRQIHAHMAGIAGVGGVIGTVVSASFLTLIALLNIQILRDLWRRYRQSPADDAGADAAIERLLARRGVMSRLLGRGYRWVDAGWKMYPLGIAFGLGFDTATEVALLGLSASAAQNAEWSAWMILALPLLFAAGMTLMDSSNGVLMQRAYSWGQHEGQRRLGFNIRITTLSVVLAMVVALMEWAELAVNEWAPDGAVAAFLGALPSGILGAVAIALFVVVWVAGYAWQSRRVAASS